MKAAAMLAFLGKESELVNGALSQRLFTPEAGSKPRCSATLSNYAGAI